MLDDVERRTFLVEPAGKDAVPPFVRQLDLNLDEGAGQLFVFPRRRRFACTKPHDDVLHPDRLSRLELEIADDSIALVQEPEHRDAVAHRGRSRGIRSDLRKIGLLDHPVLRAVLFRAAREEQQRGDGSEVAEH